MKNRPRVPAFGSFDLAIGYWLLAIRSEPQASSENADW
jgi:hypothetical protein